MQNIRKKLRSKRGASMVIAMVFMLFCAFIGGAVLAAASANGSRVRALTSEQQEFLNQRSVAGLLVDELKAPTGSKNRLTVVYTVTTYDPVKITDGGVKEADTSREKETARELSFSVYTGDMASRSPLRELLFEGAALRYIAESYADADNDNDIPISVATFTNFTKTKVEDFDFFLQDNKLEPLMMKITDPLGNAGFTSELVCLGGESGEPYSFAVTFGNKAQLNLHMYARVSTTKQEITGTTTYLGNNVNNTYDPTMVTYTTTIDWEDPTVVKGGVSE